MTMPRRTGREGKHMARRAMPSMSATAALLAFAALAVACRPEETVAPAPSSPARVIITPSVLDTLFSRDTVRLTAAAYDVHGNRLTWPLTWGTSPPVYFVLLPPPSSGIAFATSVTDTSVLVFPYVNGSSVVQVYADTVVSQVTVSARQKLVAVHFAFGCPSLGVWGPPTVDPGASDSIALAVNDNAYVCVYGTDPRGDLYENTGSALHITSSDSSVAALAYVSNEADSQDLLVVGKVPGVAYLTASTTTVDGSFTVRAKVTVSSSP